MNSGMKLTNKLYLILDTPFQVSNYNIRITADVYLSQALLTSKCDDVK